MKTTGNNYLLSARKLFEYYKSLGDKAIDQVNEQQIHWHYNQESNSIAVIIKHIAGNSLSRWTDFLNTDGEKQWRNRDGEFEETTKSKAELAAFWNKGWQCLFDAIDSITENDLMRTIYIRNEAHTIMEAVNRQLAHLPYHVGQIIYIAKMTSGESWKSLSIPRGQSTAFNENRFSAKKTI